MKFLLLLILVSCGPNLQRTYTVNITYSENEMVYIKCNKMNSKNGVVLSDCKGVALLDIKSGKPEHVFTKVHSVINPTNVIVEEK